MSNIKVPSRVGVPPKRYSSQIAGSDAAAGELLLSIEDNIELTEVGPDTPAGRLLREYWHPICPSEQLPRPGAITAFELLGEKLVAYRSPSGKVGVVPENCPHRGASLAYGKVERGGLRCAYHGWLFDLDGRCTERPVETTAPPLTCHLPSYRAREQAGLVFVSLRAEGPPPFPLWDILAREDGGYRIDLQEDLRCNWLQVQENAADVTHTIYLHSHVLADKGLPDPTGFDAPLREFGFQPFPFGMVKSWRYEAPDGSALEGWGNPLIFPTMLRIETEMHWRVPINDTATRVIILAFDPDGEGVQTNRLPSRYGADGRYTMTDFYSQDAMAWETQGAIAKRSQERLGASDVGVSMFRTMLRGAIEDVKAGRQPPGQGHGDVVNLRRWMSGYLPMTAPADPTPTERLTRSEVFDDHHRSYEVPARPLQADAEDRRAVPAPS